MYTKKIFGPKTMILWTREVTLFLFLLTMAETTIFFLTDGILMIPFTPMALLGTALAFIIGFQSNAAYGRIWEARQIWGAIVNSSRTFGMMVQNSVNNDHASIHAVSDNQLKDEIQTLIYRHIAWLTALRYAMRQPRTWEYIMNEKTNREWAHLIYVPEFHEPFDQAIEPYLSDEDKQYILSKDNKQTAILYLQSQHLTKLKERKLIWEFSYLELQKVIEELTSQQGKSERIKNFPYPRQFASLLFYITWIFIALLPMGMASQFSDAANKLVSQFPGINQWFVWLSVPFSLAIMWVFYTMNRIGRVGENPYEGSANDVPISTISRAIEIDLRQNLGEDPSKIPSQFEVKSFTQM